MWEKMDCLEFERVEARAKYHNKLTYGNEKLQETINKQYREPDGTIQRKLPSKKSKTA